MCVLGAALGGCRRYADFTLPVLAPAPVPPLYLHLLPKPEIQRGQTGSWDAVDVLNPSVLKYGQSKWNFYSGFDGHTWRTGLAIQDDRESDRTWKLQGPKLSPSPETWESDYIAANGSAIIVNHEFLYWYQSGKKDAPEIGLARSSDGMKWTKQPTAVLTHGPRGSFDEMAVGDPYVIRLDGVYYLYYLGQDRAKRQRLGLARSVDGVIWEKLRSNPLLDLPAPGSGAFDENGQGEPAVFAYAGHYWMLWTGRDAHENRALSLASSSDGVNWKTSNRVFRGDQDWNRSVLADPSVVIQEGVPWVYFGGGDQPSPDERLHGQIGKGWLDTTP